MTYEEYEKKIKGTKTFLYNNRYIICSRYFYQYITTKLY